MKFSFALTFPVIFLCVLMHAFAAYAKSPPPMIDQETGRLIVDGKPYLILGGELGAIGFSPFSIESIDAPEASPPAEVYAMLDSLTPIILDHQGRHIRLPPGGFSVQRATLYRY